MWSARLLLAAQLLVCRLASDAPTTDSITASWEGPQSLSPTFDGSFGTGPPAGSQLPEAGSLLPATGSLIPEAGSHLHTRGSILPAEGSSVPPTGSHTPVTAAVPPSVMLRLGNFTIDSTKSFRVPQAPAPPPTPTPMPVDLAPHSRAEQPAAGAPHVVPAPHAHHHHDRRYGPTFEDADGNVTRVTAQLGDDANLNCRISLLQDKTVSWVRRRGSGVPELLTVGAHTYAADARVSVARRYPGNWRLVISDVRAHDEGVYECQISTHPSRVSRTYLHVNTPQVWVVDEAGAPLLEKYYEAESTLALVCRARAVDVPVALAWLHEGRALNADTTRGGISVRTEQVAGGADSTLRLARVNASDAGNYTCAVRGARPHTVAVHVLNEESLAELHAGADSSSLGAPAAAFSVAFALILAVDSTRLREAVSRLNALPSVAVLATLLVLSLPLLAATRGKSELVIT